MPFVPVLVSNSHCALEVIYYRLQKVTLLLSKCQSWESSHTLLEPYQG